MLSTSRRSVRAHYLGRVKLTDSIRTKGHFTASGEVPEYSVIPTVSVACRIPSRMPRYRSFATGMYFDSYQLVTAGWMNPMQGFVLRAGYVCSIERAEKSRPHRRRKRGLRKGSCRSRGRHPRRSTPVTASVSKTPSARKVNHSGRKFLWAMRASESLRKDCKRYAKFPVGQMPLDSPRRIERKKAKEHCRAKWTRLHRQAEAMGIPPVAAFHATFWKYLSVETSRGYADWDSLLSGLPGNPATDYRPVGAARGNRSMGLLERLNANLEARGSKRRTRGGTPVVPKQSIGGSRGSLPKRGPRQ